METISPETKAIWCQQEKEFKEPEFVAVMSSLGFMVRPNYTSKFDIDMLVENNLADVKRNGTPWFIRDPLYTSPFNCKDYVNYTENYPKCDIYFWTEREHGRKYPVRMEDGEKTYLGPTVSLITKVNMARIVELVKNGIAVYHEYKHRVNDQFGNAKDSWLFDIREFDLLARKLDGAWQKSSWTEEELNDYRPRRAIREMDE